jgi:hypothetical protein
MIKHSIGTPLRPRLACVKASLEILLKDIKKATELNEGMSGDDFNLVTTIGAALESVESALENYTTFASLK